MFTAGTYLMLLVCFVWFVAFLYTLYVDLRDEERKNEAIAQHGEDGLDPFLFSGERARQEATDMYLKDPVCREFFDEKGVTKFLNLEGGRKA